MFYVYIGDLKAIHKEIEKVSKENNMEIKYSKDITKEQFYKANNAHSDGVYQWYEDEIYHFEKYNLKLNDDFIQHVLSNF